MPVSSGRSAGAASARIVGRVIVEARKPARTTSGLFIGTLLSDPCCRKEAITFRFLRTLSSGEDTTGLVGQGKGASPPFVAEVLSEPSQPRQPEPLPTA